MERSTLPQLHNVVSITPQEVESSNLYLVCTVVWMLTKRWGKVKFTLSTYYSVINATRHGKFKFTPSSTVVSLMLQDIERSNSHWVCTVVSLTLQDMERSNSHQVCTEGSLMPKNVERSNSHWVVTVVSPMLQDMEMSNWHQVKTQYTQRCH